LLNSIFFPDAYTGYAVGRGGTILKTTNGGGPVGVSNSQHATGLLNIYPNPSYNYIIVETSLKGSLAIFNTRGQELITHQIHESMTQIDISTLPKGIYFLKLTNERTVQVGKIIKQ
jgi:photosystem II stability/assembly factor-like uncharacterized protein